MPDNNTPVVPIDPLAGLPSVKEAASILGIHPSTCRRWISQGVLRAVRIGKTTLRVDLSSLRYETIGGAA